MVKVKLFGLFRMDTGLKELNVKADAVKGLYPLLLAEAKKSRPGCAVSSADLDGCIILINGKPGKKNSKLEDGDTVMLLSPVCGG